MGKSFQSTFFPTNCPPRWYSSAFPGVPSVLRSLFDRDCAPRLTRRTGGGGGGANEAHVGGGEFGANEAHGGGGGLVLTRRTGGGGSLAPTRRTGGGGVWR